MGYKYKAQEDKHKTNVKKQAAMMDIFFKYGYVHEMLLSRLHSNDIKYKTT